MGVSMKKGNPKKPLDSASVCGHEDPACVRELLSKVGDKWSISFDTLIGEIAGGARSIY